MSKIRYYLIAAFAVSGVVGGVFYYQYTKKHMLPTVQLVDFEYDRDVADVLSIFDRNWYWLMPYSQEEYEPDYLPHVFAWRAPQANPFKKGTLTIKVIRHEGH